MDGFQYAHRSTPFVGDYWTTEVKLGATVPRPVASAINFLASVQGLAQPEDPIFI